MYTHMIYNMLILYAYIVYIITCYIYIYKYKFTQQFYNLCNSDKISISVSHYKF